MDSAIIELLANAGVAGVIIVVIITGLLVPKPYFARLEEENRLLREALELERVRASEAASTAGTTNKLIGALTDLAAERRALPSLHSHKDPAATWKDIG